MLGLACAVGGTREKPLERSEESRSHAAHSLRAPWPMRMPNMPPAPCCAANSWRSRFGLLSAHGSSSQGLKTETPGQTGEVPLRGS